MGSSFVFFNVALRRLWINYW